MKLYVLSLAVGVFVGIIYSVLNVRSPAPPLVALVGLLGILMGEQAMSVAQEPEAKLWAGAWLASDNTQRKLAHLPAQKVTRPTFATHEEQS